MGAPSPSSMAETSFSSISRAPHPICASAPTPAHTLARPNPPDAPVDDANPNLEALKTRTLFITWHAPFSHYLPLLDAQLSTQQAGTTDVTTVDLAPDATAFNLTDLSNFLHVVFGHRTGVVS